MERKLVHPEHGVRIICREGEVVTVYDSKLVELDERVCATEITAKAYETFLLHYFADMGFKPTS
ncbi:MAG: hypothetical protein [Caudoviricetes sp.]|nr:MAG: hypothetical protein [Caudoviricetes sp.]